jgi:RNA polymerase sigma factor (sigma-70 family)
VTNRLPPPVVQTAEDLLLEFERTGDPAPFEEIVRRYSGMVYGVCYRVTRNAHDAEDATQATFLKLATQARTTSGVPRVGPWLQQVAKTTAVDLRRSRTRRQNREQIRAGIIDQQQEHVHAADEAGMDELKQLLRDEVDRLPVHYRTPLVLYYFGGLSTEQIAVELKSNAKALAVRLFRARKMLGGRLKDRGVASAGGALVCLTVADAILAGLAKSTFPAAPAAYAAAGGYAAAPGASAWLTSHATVLSALGDRISATLRACALAGAAGKWKASVALLLSVGTATAGASSTVRNSPVIREIGGWLIDLNGTINGLSRYRNLFRSLSGPLRADAAPSAAPPSAPPPSRLAEGAVVVPPPAVPAAVAGPAEYPPPAGPIAPYPRPPHAAPVDGGCRASPGRPPGRRAGGEHAAWGCRRVR